MSKKIRIRHHVNPMSDRTEVEFDGFINNKPIIVDVGAASGEFVSKLIELKSDTHNFVIFEIRKPLAKKLEEKFANKDNVKVFEGDAGRNFKSVLYPCIKRGAKIEEIFINFPDPWFKDRHKKRRFINENFLNNVSQWIQIETKWIFQTDQKELFEDTIELLNKKNISDIVFFNNSPYDTKTKWESAKMEVGDEIYRMKFNIINLKI